MLTRYFVVVTFDKHGMMKQATVSGTESKSFSLVEILVFFYYFVKRLFG